LTPIESREGVKNRGPVKKKGSNNLEETQKRKEKRKGRKLTPNTSKESRGDKPERVID
jgi:hypothetical protein